ncbi:MAG: hypothetical protein Edafosvirus26_10 [Edafosvirus sp.]|uniref:Uncharacterized protein n=1 Tax=Edafosvirus sp. TaxID=2487765 RepID=A0A3G4ZUX6_9VIRU|nr:MAG: hypothetical protein Edafosvirus26_10 [Edafosvirus sp.]
MSEKDKHINGPINVVRLEGTVFDIKKVLYVFMDYHSPVCAQSQCDDPLSDDIKKYMTENFMNIEKQKKDKMYDLFYEVFPTHTSRKLSKIKGRYIDEIFRLFGDQFNYDEKNDKVLPSKIFSHVRFHYIDIRDYFYHFIWPILTDLVSFSRTLYSNMNIYPNDIKYIDEKLRIVEGEIVHTYDILFSDGKYKPKKVKENKEKKGGAKATAPITEQSYEEQLKNFTNKILNRYNHEEVKKVINDFLNDYVKYKFDVALDTIIKLRDKLPNYFADMNMPNDKLAIRKDDTNSAHKYGWGPDFKTMRNIIGDLYDMISILDNEVSLAFLTIMDIYFLRRFLDKDYITNGITYTGILHSMTYVYILIKYFGFEITNFSYSSEKNIKQLNKKVKNIPVDNFKKDYDINDLFYPEILVQCSNLSDFPKNFN